MTNINFKTSEYVAMTAYQLLAAIFIGDRKFTEEEQIIILDWFDICACGEEIGDLNTMTIPIQEFER